MVSENERLTLGETDHFHQLFNESFTLGGRLRGELPLCACVQMTLEYMALDMLQVPLHGEGELKNLGTVGILLDHGFQLRHQAFQSLDRIL